MEHILKKASAIQLLILDVDGVLTSGHIFYDQAGGEIKCFHILDGLGIKLLQANGIHVAIISGRNSPALQQRITELQIKHAYLGHELKIPAFKELQNKLNLQQNQIAYMGDDLPDLALFKLAGLSLTVPNAPTIMQQHADLVTTKSGGEGAVREVCDMLLKAQGKYDAILNSYLEK